MTERQLVALAIIAIPAAASLYAWLASASWDRTRPPHYWQDKDGHDILQWDERRRQ